MRSVKPLHVKRSVGGCASGSIPPALTIFKKGKSVKKKIIVLLAIILFHSKSFAFDPFCFKEYKNDVQMQEYCEMVQNEMSYAVAQYYGIMEMAKEQDEIRIIKTCYEMFKGKDKDVDWENVYNCIINY